MFAVALVGIVTLHTHKFTLLLTAMLLVGAYEMVPRKVVGIWVWAKVISLVILVIGIAIGLISVELVMHWRTANDTLEARMLIGERSGNAVHLALFSVLVMWYAVHNRPMRLWHAVLWMAANIALYRYVTTSLAGLLMTTFAIVTMLIITHSETSLKFMARISVLMPFVLLAVSLVVGYSYGHSEIANTLNRLFTGRVAYDHIHLVSGGIDLFGNSYSHLLGQGAFDNSYVYLVVVFGAVPTFLLLAAETKLLNILSHGDKTHQIEAVACFLFLVYGLAESMWPSAVVNPTVFYLLYLAADGSKGGISCK